MREKILAVIEKNSRIDIKDLAALLGESEVAIANEIAAMEKENIICGYHTPVSYTHLDVYKRQELSQAIMNRLCKAAGYHMMNV